jgi:mono/diheme cytochrome c family protein
MGQPQRAANNSTSPGDAAITGAKEDPKAVDRGAKLFATNCGGCHGVNAKGGPGAPDLIRSVLVLDDEKGILIAPVLREGRPDQGMPKPNLTEPQISDIVAWLHVQTYAADHRATYTFLDVVTGDAKKGQAYFNGAGKCSACHSPTGDLAGVGKKYEPFALQSKWLQPRSPRGATPSDSPRSAIKVTVTPPSGQAVSGTLDHIDDFNVSLYDSAGEYHSFARDGATPKVDLNDPLKTHRDLLAHYSDADIHNVTAFLVTLK